MEEISVVFCTNSKGYDHTIVSMVSILKNTSNKVKFYIVHDDDMSCETKIKFLKVSSETYFIPFDRELLKQFDTEVKTRPWWYWKHVTVETYIRIFLPAILDIPKIIYLDTDIIFEGDISYIWAFKISDGHICAMCQEPDLDFNVEQSYETYNQAGVIVMYLDEMRKRNFLPKLLERNKLEVSNQEFYEHYDQGLIHREFSDLITKLPIYFNFHRGVLLYNQDIPLDNADYLNELFGEDFMKKVISYHYTNAIKAWDIPNSRYYKYKEMLNE